MKKKLLEWYSIIKETGEEFLKNSGPKHSAALAYYTVFSLAPMLIVIIWIGTRIFGQDALEGKVYDKISNFIGERAARQIEDIITNITLNEDATIPAIIGLITLFLGATVVFIEIQDTLNQIWGVKPKPKRGFLKLILNRLLSFSIVIGIGFLMLLSLIINALVTGLSHLLQKVIPEINYILTHTLNFLTTFIIITVLFVFIFKFLPDAKIQWKDVTVGAIATSVLFILGKFCISLYLSLSDIGSAYGAAGSLIVILAWVYYSSIILFFGAEFTRIYARYFGGKIIPADYAVLVEIREVEKNLT